MKEFLEKLWWDGLAPRRACKADDPTFADHQRIRREKRRELYETLNEDQRRRLEEYEHFLESEHAVFSQEAFVQGFRIGAQMIESIK